MVKVITILIIVFLPYFAMAQLVVKEATNKVGVGILDPTEKLELHDGKLRISGVVGTNQQINIDVEDARAGFSLKADGNGINTDDMAVFTMRNNQGDAVFSGYDHSAELWKGGYKWKYLANRFEIQGDVFANSYDTPSDKRLKSNIEDFELGLDEVMKLAPRTYFYNGKAGINSKRMHVGVLAQELQKVAPEFVSKYTYKQFDVNQEKVLAEEEYLQIHDNEIKYLLINAIKDLKLEIDELRDEVISLRRNSNSSQEDRVLEKGEVFLSQNIPNPSGITTLIHYQLPRISSNASLVFYSLAGQVVQEVQIDEPGRGIYEMNLEGLSPGHYTYSLIVDGRLIDTKKMVVAK